MIWFLAAAIAFALVTVAAAYYGSHVLFHPPRMLKMEIWPDKFDLPFETAKFKTSDGLTLSSWLIPAAKRTDRTILVFHGWGDNKGDLLQHIYFLAEDFNLFMLDFRHHGESEGRMTSLGYLETRDAEAALAYLADARPEWRKRLGVLGHSMGASLAVWSAGRYPNIKAAVLETPFASFNEVVNQFACVEYNLPYVPFGVTTLALMRWRLGADPDPYSPIFHVDRIAPRPVLLIAGETDKLMPVEVVRRVYDKAGYPKELWVVPGAAHGQCAQAGGEEYKRRLREFFHKHL